MFPFRSVIVLVFLLIAWIVPLRRSSFGSFAFCAFPCSSFVYTGPARDRESAIPRNNPSAIDRLRRMNPPCLDWNLGLPTVIGSTGKVKCGKRPAAADLDDFRKDLKMIQ